MIFARISEYAIIASVFLLLIPRQTESALSSTEGEDEIAIAMAGGSHRAAAACFGVLRGLSQKKIPDPINLENEISAMDLVAYNSAISGGAIPAMIYAYARVPTEELLETNRTIDPSKITKEELSRMPKNSMGYVISQKPDALWRAILISVKMFLNPLNIFKYHSVWTVGVHEKLLKPLNIPKNKYFTSSKKELDKILEENPKLKESDFLIPREDVKTGTMVLITMHGSRADFNAYNKNFQTILYHALKEYNEQKNSGKRPNMTDIILSIRDKLGSNLPMPYVITPDIVENKYCGDVLVGKKIIQSPEKNVRPFEWGSKKGRFGRKARFSVETLTGMATNFLGMRPILAAQFVTQIRKITLSDGSEVSQRFADGGTSDIMGILPLVARGTKNIISVYAFNQNLPKCFFNSTYADIYKVANVTSLDDPDFELQFQEWSKHISPSLTMMFGLINATGSIWPYPLIMNHVFYDPNSDRLKELMIKFNSLFKAGEPLIATLHDLEVIDNPFWGIKGGNTINLTLMYFNMPKKFSERIPEDAVPPAEGKSKIDGDGRFTNEELRAVPELRVDGVNQLLYTNAEVNMMGYLGSWMINHSWDGLYGEDGEILFEGFGKIFGKK